MTRAVIITHFETHIAEYKQYSRNIAGEDSDDLFQLCALELLEFPEERLVSYWNEREGLKPFFIRLLCNQYRSKTSKYHREYRRQNDFVRRKGNDVARHADHLDVPDPVLDIMKIETIIDKVHELNNELFPCEIEKVVFEEYVKQGSLRKVLASLPASVTDRLDLKEVHQIVKKYRNTIKKHL